VTNARLPRGGGGGGHVTYGQFDAAGPRDDAEFIAIQRLTMAADDGAMRGASRRMGHWRGSAEAAKSSIVR